MASEEDAPVEFDSEIDEQKSSQVEQENKEEDDLISIDYDQTPDQCVRQKGMAFINWNWKDKCKLQSQWAKTKKLFVLPYQVCRNRWENDGVFVRGSCGDELLTLYDGWCW